MLPNCFGLLFEPWAVPVLKLDAVPLSLVVIVVIVVKVLVLVVLIVLVVVVVVVVYE